jgi:hypothetical protein
MNWRTGLAWWPVATGLVAIGLLIVGIQESRRETQAVEEKQAAGARWEAAYSACASTRDEYCLLDYMLRQHGSSASSNN